jgi:beta-lactamase class A
LSNKTTARDLGLLMQILGKGNQFPEALNADMLAILKAQKFNEMIPAGLPEGTVVAHKTGNITKHHHDAALVYPPNKSPYVLVILIKGIADIKESAKIGARISGAISVMR